MRKIAALFVLALLLGVSIRAEAEPDIVVVTTADAPVDAQEVRELLQRELPGLQISSDRAEGGPDASLVTIATWSDGRLAVSFRDGTGRETFRLVDPGTQPAATVAMIVVNLQSNQLEGLLETPAPAARRSPAATQPADRSVRAVVSREGARVPAATVGLELGLMQRTFEVALPGAPQPRTYQAPGFFAWRLEGALFPWRLAGERGPSSWLGAKISFERPIALETTGIDATTSEPIPIETAYQDVRAALLFDAPLGESATAARIRVAAGWNTSEFYFAAEDMAQIPQEHQMPSVQYYGPAVEVGTDVPFGSSGITGRARIGAHAILDVGQAVRDLFGADTKGATGISAELGVGGRVVPRLEWGVSAEVRRVYTEMSGPSVMDGGILMDGVAGLDEYLALRVAVAYRPD